MIRFLPCGLICFCGLLFCFGGCGSGSGSVDTEDTLTSDNISTETAGTTGSDSNEDSGSDTGGDSGPDTSLDSGTETDPGTDTNVDSGSDSNNGLDTESSVNDTGTDTGTHGDSDTLLDTATDTVRDTGNETDSGNGADTEPSVTDSDSGSDTDEIESDSESEIPVSCIPTELPADAEALMNGAFQTKLDPADVRGYSPDVAISGCRVHAVWSSDGLLNYRKGDNLGAPLLTRVALVSDESITFRVEPQLKVDNDLVVVAWQRSGIWYMVSRDGGDSFGDAAVLEDINRTFTLTVTDAGRFVLLYVDAGTGVMCLESQNFGSTWSEPVVVVPEPEENVWGGAFAATDGQSIHATLLQGSYMSTTHQIYYASSEDGCMGWGAPVPISEIMDNDMMSAAAGSVVPVMAISGNNLDAIWSERLPDDFSGTRIYHRRSTDSGKTWGSISTLETVGGTYSGMLTSKDVAAVGNDIKIVSSNGLIESADGGLTWSEIDDDLSGSAVAASAGGTVIAHIAPIAELYLIGRP